MNKLDILLITYNHESYIKQCLDSITIQKASFDFGIIVADDYSTDNTLSIIQEYSGKCNIPIRILETAGNLGLVKNYQRALTACKSEYVAVLEGDDYWTSPYRLQKHIDFLDIHQECSMVFNRYVAFNQNSDNFNIANDKMKEEDRYVTIRELARGNIIGNFSTCTYRKSVIDRLDPGIFDMKIADWMFNLCISQSGLIGRIGEALSVYRIHSGGEWSNKSRKDKLKEEYEAAVEYDRYFNFQYHQEFYSLQRCILNEMDELAGRFRLNKRSIKKYCPPIIWWLVRMFYPKQL